MGDSGLQNCKTHATDAASEARDGEQINAPCDVLNRPKMEVLPTLRLMATSSLSIHGEEDSLQLDYDDHYCYIMRKVRFLVY
jgi:hypothetical protein